jgi:hypothetical protein
MRLVIAVSALLTIAAGPPAPAGERVALAPLPGFTLAFREEGDGNLIEERIPLGETVQRWTRMVTIQRFAGVVQRADAATYLGIIRNNLPRSCPGGTTSAISALIVSGHRAARLRADCPRNPQTGLPETFEIVAIEGASDIHVAQVAFRRVPSAADLAWSDRQLAGVALCTGSSREPACAAR